MKSAMTGVWVWGLLTLAGSANSAELAEPASARDKVSYSIGLDVARNFKKNNIDFDPAMVMRGLEDGLSGVRPKLDEKEFRKILNDFQVHVRQQMSANMRTLTVENRNKSDAFLLANKSREGVNALHSGMQFKVLKAGDGPRPTDVDSVTMNYRGTLLDGKQFDATEPGKPGTVSLLQLFIGFKEVLKMMPTGSHWQVWIPAQLAYGERGVGSDVGPNDLLTYDIELLAVHAHGGEN